MHPTTSGSPGPVVSPPGTAERTRPRNRHFPRVCAACQAPMSGQGDVCWSCGTPWTDPAVPAATGTHA